MSAPGAAPTPNGEPPWAGVRPGDVLAGKYVVDGLLGAGGMGVVLSARHTPSGQRVAMKVLLPEAVALDGGAARFVREANASASLRSENVVRLLDVGTLESGAPFMVMELLTGRDLRDELKRRGAFPVAEAVQCLIQLCEALIEAHARGIVHRDLKPANLFLTHRPNGALLIKVLDFGLAKMDAGNNLRSANDHVTMTGVVVGSPPYMSPEQLRSLKLADKRSDIWSVGVIAYELLSGERPFQAESAPGLITSIIVDEPMPLRSRKPDIPEALAAIVHHCLCKDPRARPQTVQEVAVALEAFAPPGMRASLASIAVLEAAGPPPASVRDLALPEVAPPSRPAPRAGAAKLPISSPGAPPPASSEGPQTTTLSIGSSEVSAPEAASGRKPIVLAVVVATLIAVTLMMWVAQGPSSTPEEALSAPSDSAPAAAVGSGAPPQETAQPVSETTSGEAPATATAAAVEPSASAEAPDDAPASGETTSSPAGSSTASASASQPARVRVPYRPKKPSTSDWR